MLKLLRKFFPQKPEPVEPDPGKRFEEEAFQTLVTEVEKTNKELNVENDRLSQLLSSMKEDNNV